MNIVFTEHAHTLEVRVLDARAPRRDARGPWTHGAMRGYSSRGTGSSGLFARFFSPPEIVLHRLERA